MYELIEYTVNLLQKGVEEVASGSESASGIKTLAPRIVELAEAQSNIPGLRGNPFANEDEDDMLNGPWQA